MMKSQTITRFWENGGKKVVFLISKIRQKHIVLNTDFACSVRAAMPAANGAEADVPVLFQGANDFKRNEKGFFKLRI